ncbi:MAG: DUF3209 family protein [Pirellulales bacterium]|nr:DUF3209 family protein [Pirellulales bacterium]
MACHELAALRLGLMKLCGIDDPNEKEHELAELGDAVHEPGPIQSLCGPEDLTKLVSYYQASLVDLQQRVAQTAEDNPKLPYFQALILVTKKVEQELQVHINNLKQLYEDLDDIHHLIHEVYPSKKKD